MTPSAPRYHPAVHAAIERLDDGEIAFAQLWRDVAGLADELGVTRPSYSHVRRRALVIREVRLARGTIATMLRRGERRRFVPLRYERGA